MKRTELKFPCTLSWDKDSRTTYVATESLTRKDRVDLVSSYGRTFPAYMDTRDILSLINNGTVTVVKEPKEADLTITVDSSALTRTIAEMKEATAVAIDLEAALLRVKALLA